VLDQPFVTTAAKSDLGGALVEDREDRSRCQRAPTSGRGWRSSSVHPSHR
jgi:hypothetical protein